MLTGDSVRQNTWFITKLSACQIQRTQHWKKKSDILHKPVYVSWGTRSCLMSVVVRSAYLRTTYYPNQWMLETRDSRSPSGGQESNCTGSTGSWGWIQYIGYFKSLFV